MTNALLETVKNTTFGCEIEMYNIPFEKAIPAIAKGLDNAGGVETVHDAYYVRECVSGRKWTLTGDCSIRGRNTAEFVTPILKYEDMGKLQEIARELRRAGAKSDPEHRCGVHVHIGADGHTDRSLVTLMALMRKYEDLLYYALDVSPDREYYCRKMEGKLADAAYNIATRRVMPSSVFNPTSRDVNGKFVRNLWYLMQGENPNSTPWDCHYDDTRYHGLNLHSVFYRGTVEFRLFQFEPACRNRKNGIHAGRLKTFVQLCLALNQKAKDLAAGRESLDMEKAPISRQSMLDMLLFLDMRGSAFATARKFLLEKFAAEAELAA